MSYTVTNIALPTTKDEAVQVLRTFHKDCNGGFHPDDSGSEILAPNGEPAFDEENAQHYDSLNQAIWQQLGEDAIYDTLNALDVEFGYRAGDPENH